MAANELSESHVHCRSSFFLLSSLPRSACDNELVILIESVCPAEMEQLFDGDNEVLNLGLSAFKLTMIHFPSPQKYAFKRFPANSNSEDT
jgi:hypothetical protein